MLLNYITSQDLEQVSGGWSGLSSNLYRKIFQTRSLNVRYLGPVNPPISRTAKLVSKVRRVLGARGRFYAFSEGRLARVRQQVQTARFQADYDFFLGATPWIRCRFDRPYGAYLDACFRTYFNNNLKVNEFCPKDIRRIELAEKAWLERANHVFWASAWSRDEAIRHYGLTSSNHHVVGIGGNLDVPEEDTWTGQSHFLFIAQNFALKGGPVACSAFQTVHQKHPETKLIILGQKPPPRILQQPGVEYAGYLRKSHPAELARFRSILASAFCLVYPTTSDTIGQVIIECGYYGCPAIAPAKFGIPEIILNAQTGILVEVPFDHADLEKQMLSMIEHPEAYKELRRNVRERCTDNFTFGVVAGRIGHQIATVVPETLCENGRTTESLI
ncbi:MAG: glycosyltransferase family 4 protein [Verrucomicrobiota bacterium]